MGKAFDKASAERFDWKWQQRNSVKDVKQIRKYFTKIDGSFFDNLFNQSGERLRFQVTPYMLSQIPQDISKEKLESNPWFLQFFPLGDLHLEGSDAYDGTENWDMPEEFPTSIIQHKYTNRALLRFRNCLAYCNFCFEALGTLEKNPKPEKVLRWKEWEKSLKYIQEIPGIEEVILSGGEPLLLSNSKLEKILQDVSEIKDNEGKQKIRLKRIHTRVLTHNPYRIDSDLIKIFRTYKINEIAFDVAHPSEITDEFKNVVYKIKEESGKDTPILASHTPLVKNINANSEILWDLFKNLYQIGIKPYYLIHSFPHTPFANQQRVSVRDGVRLIKDLKRHKSNIAIPEYILAHYKGKITVPLETGGTPEFQYIEEGDKNYIKFLNWKNNWVEYPDIKDTLD